MNVTDAVNARKSIRAFRPDPVSDDTIAKLLATASRAPSGGNLQPWRIYVVNGESMARFRAFLTDRPPGVPAYDIYPPKLPEPYRSARFKVGEDLYASIGVSREDKEGRFAQFAKNLDFFGAPAAVFCFVDAIMGPPQWSDLGMFLQTFMLASEEVGLQTCPQEAWAVHEQAVSEFVGAPQNERIFCGVAIGHADMEHPINGFESDRFPLEEFVTFV